MDLTVLKWPIIVGILAAVAFLLSSPGTDYLYEGVIEDPVGADRDQDAANEAMLTRLGGFMLMTFRYEKAAKMYQTAINRYRDGENAWYNYYQLARCLEKLERYGDAVDILVMLRDENADQYDERVQNPAQLDARIQRLVEVHELSPRPWKR